MRQLNRPQEKSLYCPICLDRVQRYTLSGTRVTTTFSCGTKVDAAGKVLFQSKECLRREVALLKSRLEDARFFEKAASEVACEIASVHEAKGILADKEQEWADRILTVLPC